MKKNNNFLEVPNINSSDAWTNGSNNTISNTDGDVPPLQLSNLIDNRKIIIKPIVLKILDLTQVKIILMTDILLKEEQI